MRRDRKPVVRDEGRALLVALVASLAVHALVVALLSVANPAAPPAREPIWFDVELRREPAPADDAAPAQAVPPAPSRRSAAGPRRAPAAPTDAARPPDAATGGAAPGAAAEALYGPPRRAAPDLRVRPPDGFISGEGGGHAGGGGGDAPRNAVEEWAHDRAARARVRSGAIHPYFADLGRALASRWDAEPVLEKRGGAGRLAQLGQNLASFGRAWRRTAEGYGATGSPGVIDGASDRMRELTGLPPGPARDALVAAESQRQLRPVLSEGHVSTVRVTQAIDGRLLLVELLGPSKDRELDRAAVAGVRAAVQALPPPPAAAVGDRDAFVSTWEFEIEISITPPVPAVLVEFDEARGLTDFRVPLDRRVRKRVRLVALN